jgi:outer membrane protein OmpA-like peptidoglycan-associated protein
MQSMKRFMHRTGRVSCLIIALALLAVGAHAQSGKNLIINHFVSDPAVIEGHIVVSDVEGTGGSVKLMFYDQEGNLAGQGNESIPANGKINVNPDKYTQGKKMVGTVRISASRPMTGQYWQFYKDSKLGWKNIAVPAAVQPGSTKLVCQHFVSDPNIESYLVVAEASGKNTTVYVDFYSDNGDLAGQTKIDIPANGKFSIEPYDLVGKKVMTGVAYIQSEAGAITGEYWQVSAREKYQVAHAMQGSAPDAATLANAKIMRVLVNFDFDSDKIQKRSNNDLNEVAKAMKKNKTAKYEIGGYTDNKGKDDYNVKLSERRANAVKDYLVKVGKVNAKQLVTKGYGPASPIADNNTEAGRAKNRRVEFKKL